MSAPVVNGGEDLKLVANIIVPIATFIAGFFVSRYTMTKKERKDHAQNLQASADAYQKDLTEAYESFTKSLAVYAQKIEGPTFDDFFSISSSGEKYFTQLRMMCNASLNGTVEPSTVISTLAPFIKEAWERIIPKFYEVLGQIARKNNMQWNGELRRSNYENIASFYEKFCTR